MGTEGGVTRNNIVTCGTCTQQLIIPNVLRDLEIQFELCYARVYELMRETDREEDHCKAEQFKENACRDKHLDLQSSTT